VIDQWKIIEALSPGGMGAVYRVQHVRLGKRGALKVPLPGADKVRFEREWQLLDQLKRSLARFSGHFGLGDHAAGWAAV
jgi:serine/threonine protein kinase